MGLSGFGLGMGGLTIFRRGLEWVWGGLGCVWVRRAWGWEWVWPGLGLRGLGLCWVCGGFGWVWAGFGVGLGGFGLGLGGFDHV